MLKNTKIGRDISAALGEIFKNVPLHPNVITSFSLIFALLAFFVYSYDGWIAFGLFMLALFADAVDGAVARAKDLESKKGAFIDGVLDRIVEFFIIMTLFQMPIPTLIVPKDIWLLLTLFFGTGMTSYVKAYAEHTGVLMHRDALNLPGIMERTERCLLLLVVLLLTLLKSDISAVVLMFTAVLSFITFLERFVRVLGSNPLDSK